MVSSRVVADSLAPEVRGALIAYCAWWYEEGDGDCPDLPFGDSLFIGWEVVTPNGKRFEASIPKFDLSSGRVVWRCGGLIVADTTEG